MKKFLLLILALTTAVVAGAVFSPVKSSNADVTCTTESCSSDDTCYFVQGECPAPPVLEPQPDVTPAIAPEAATAPPVDGATTPAVAPTCQ